MGALSQLLSGALIPLVFFPDLVQKIIQVLPFSSIIYTPVMIYLGKLSGMDVAYFILLQLFWLLVMVMLSRTVWKAVVKSLTILGG